MGLFATKKDWSTCVIESNSPWSKYARPYPNTIEIVRDAARKSGVDPQLIDLPGAITRVWRLIIHVADELLDDRRAIAALGKIADRSDLDDQKIWDFLTQQGSYGVAIRNTIIERYFDNGTMVESLVALITDGTLQVQLGGQDRIVDGPPESQLQGRDRI